MLNSLFYNINDLIQDQYGNYVIQFILENQAINNQDLLPIFQSLKGNIYQYSFHKFANYVVQKIIEFSESNIQQELIRIILSRQNKIKNEGFSKHVLNYIEKLNSGNNKGIKFKNNAGIYKQYK